ncbi:hypothetical protein ECZC05_49840 [Escherichia coli]|nr:hypothetical protein ECZC02_49510 [Escherichia coli]GJH70011.1 hypothetical protein ECZC05_49840 [Escherichia coli]GJH75865.1 hypothetical protein ECZC06_54590 [Escherichia coli]GJH86417.1 hypothetical protein ECZC08_49870 [Escherichia coli]GJH96995.1 hypothetical protein ECZC10_48430 [Escherichia coli]
MVVKTVHGCGVSSIFPFLTGNFRHNRAFYRTEVIDPYSNSGEVLSSLIDFINILPIACELLIK